MNNRRIEWLMSMAENAIYDLGLDGLFLDRNVDASLTPLQSAALGLVLERVVQTHNADDPNENPIDSVELVLAGHRWSDRTLNAGAFFSNYHEQWTRLGIEDPDASVLDYAVDGYIQSGLADDVMNAYAAAQSWIGHIQEKLSLPDTHQDIENLFMSGLEDHLTRHGLDLTAVLDRQEWLMASVSTWNQLQITMEFLQGTPILPGGKLTSLLDGLRPQLDLCPCYSLPHAVGLILQPRQRMIDDLIRVPLEMTVDGLKAEDIDLADITYDE